jgi:hypothetical protein
MVRLDQEWYYMAMRTMNNVQLVRFSAKNRKSVLAVCSIRLNGQTDRVIRTVRITIRTRTAPYHLVGRRVELTLDLILEWYWYFVM